MLKVKQNCFYESLFIIRFIHYLVYTFYFLLPVSRKILFLGQIFEMEILMDFLVLRFHKSENHIFSSWSVCMYVYVSVSVISLTQKQITAETSNLIFYIFVIYRCCLKLFMKIGQKHCV